MGMTSVVLILLAISVRVVSWVDLALQRREARCEAIEPESDENGGTTIEDVEVETSDSRARAAAIAVALALSRHSQSPRGSAAAIPISSQTGAVHDAWLTEGRARQRATRGAGGAKEWR